MTNYHAVRWGTALGLGVMLAGAALPAQAQDTDARLRRLEAEVRALKHEAGADHTIAPQAVPETVTVVPGAPASTPMTDLLARVDALEGQLTRLTAQSEEAGNRIHQLETRVTAVEATLHPAPADAPGATVAPSGTGFDPDSSAGSANIAAMTDNASLHPASVASTRASSLTAKAPTAERLAAVRAVVKPQTGDPGEDEYSYGFHLWEAKLYPEAEQQLKLFLDKYPRHKRVSYARNLMGRTLLDEDKPREAAPWFLQNYQADKHGARGPDSLLLLAESMRRLGDTSRACIALGEFAQTFPAEAAGRLKGQYDDTRNGVKCN